MNSLIVCAVCLRRQTGSGDLIKERNLCGKLRLERAEAVLEREAHIPRLDRALAPLWDVELLVRCAAPQVEENRPASCRGAPLAGKERGRNVWRERSLGEPSALGLRAAATVRARGPDVE